MPPVKVTWYDGGLKPERPEELEEGRKVTGSTCSTIFVGEKGKIICGEYGGSPRLIPESKMRDFKRPCKSLERIPDGTAGHEADWIRACKGGKPACSNFDYAGPLTELVVLGNLAVRFPNQRLYWDSEKMEVTNFPGANEFVKPTFRKGFIM